MAACEVEPNFIHPQLFLDFADLVGKYILLRGQLLKFLLSADDHVGPIFFIPAINIIQFFLPQ